MTFTRTGSFPESQKKEDAFFEFIRNLTCVKAASVRDLDANSIARGLQGAVPQDSNQERRKPQIRRKTRNCILGSLPVPPSFREFGVFCGSPNYAHGTQAARRIYQ